MSDVRESVCCCPYGGAWYLLCSHCGAVMVMSRDHKCRSCGTLNKDAREVSRDEFEKITGRRW